MNIQVKTQNGDKYSSEKLYTQQEVNASLQAQEKRLSPQTAVKDEIQIIEDKAVEDKNTIKELVNKSNRILVSITSIFPFDLFPDTINVEEGRISIITRNFFFSSQVHSVDIKDISNVLINTAPFFAQLIIVSTTFANNEIRIRNLNKGDAIFARRIIEGLRIFVNKKIDTSKYTKEELLAQLKELSTTEIVT